MNRVTYGDGTISYSRKRCIRLWITGCWGVSQYFSYFRTMWQSSYTPTLKILSATRCFEKLPESVFRFTQEIIKGARPLLAEHQRGCINIMEIRNLWPLFETCWDGDPAVRPTITLIKAALHTELMGQNIQVCAVDAPNCLHKSEFFAGIKLEQWPFLPPHFILYNLTRIP